MKPILFVILLFSTSSLISQTTQTFDTPGFLYAQKGLLDDLKNGKDPQKNGYEFERIHHQKHQQGFSNANIHTYQIRGTSCNCTLAYAIYINPYGNGSSYVFPVDLNEEITNRYNNQFKDIGSWDSKLIFMSLPQVINN